MFKIGTKLKRVVALVVAVLFTVLLFSTLIFNIVNADNEQLNKLNDEKTEIKNEINVLEGQKKDIMAEKQELDDQVTELEGEIDKVNVEIDDYQVKINEASAELDKAAQKLDAQFETYKTRIRVMYENSAIGYVDVLLSAENIGDFFEKLEIVSQIAEYDNNLLAHLKEEKQKIQDKKDELEGLQGKLVASKNDLESKKSTLDSKMAERDAMIQEIEGSKSALEAQLREIEAEEAAVRAQIGNMSSGSTVAYSGGSMLWPTPSCKIVTSYYGWRLHPVLGYEKLHTGVDIGAGYGAKIIAAQSGKVIKATYNAAYGNYIVIDHGGGVCTLYAHQSSMAASVGQTVSAGQVIGYVGSTGYSTGPHLHFEVIINGATTDPLGYIS